MRSQLACLFLATGLATAAIPIPVKPGDSIVLALEKARELRKANPDEAIEVIFSDGIYRLDGALRLGGEDSGTEKGPLRLIAAGGAKPVISGGRRIGGFTVRPDGRWETKLEGPAFEQLWINGTRAVRAREPDRGFFRMKSVKEEKREGGLASQTVEMDGEALHWLKDLSPETLGRVQMLAYHKWDNTRRFIGKVEDNQFSVTGLEMKPWNRWDEKSGFIFENLEAGLDEPGEWFLSPEGLLIYQPHPGEDPSQAEVIAPVTERLLVLDGRPHAKVKHVEIRGLSFQHAGCVSPPEGFDPNQAAAPVEAVIQMDHAEHISISNCEIAHTGLYGIWSRDGSRNHRITGCYLHDLGAGGVRIGALHPERGTGAITVEDCIIRDGGKVFPCAVAVWIGHSGDNVISHNEISHFPYTGVSIGWRWGYDTSEAKNNRVDFNHIHHIGNGLLSDMGGIYTLGPSEGTVLRNNCIHDILSYDYGGWGLYNDEGSTGILLENNLVYRTKTGGYHQHYGKENIIRNNIFAYARDQQLQFTRPEEHVSFRFTGNIVLWEKGPLWSGGSQGKGNFECDRNLYWRTDGEEPECFGKKFPEWQASGHDTGSVIADPGFVDPANGNFSFKDPAVAEKIGFKPFDPAEAGVRGAPSWKELSKKAPPNWMAK